MPLMDVFPVIVDEIGNILISIINLDKNKHLF